MSSEWEISTFEEVKSRIAADDISRENMAQIRIPSRWTFKRRYAECSFVILMKGLNPVTAVKSRQHDTDGNFTCIQPSSPSLPSPHPHHPSYLISPRSPSASLHHYTAEAEADHFLDLFLIE
nr:hypothetical protein CFP56_07568 [Quercus suber]